MMLTFEMGLRIERGAACHAFVAKRRKRYAKAKPPQYAWGLEHSRGLPSTASAMRFTDGWPMLFSIEIA